MIPSADTASRFPLVPSHPHAVPPLNFHTHVFGDGEVMPGMKSQEVLTDEARVIFRHGVKGKTVLDVGAWDGFFSFEAERRGAARVLATDNFCWSGPGWGTRQGFEYAHAKLGSSVEALDVDIPDLSPDQIGTFDVVLFLGVIYHVKDPLRSIEQVSKLVGEMIIVDTETALDSLPEPVMRYYLGGEMAGDDTNFWAPNKLCLERMFREVGFTRFEFTDHPHCVCTDQRGRVFMHAWK